MPQVVSRTIVPAVGVGRVDYSDDASFATEQLLRLSQLRIFWSAKYLNVPPRPIWSVYESLLAFPPGPPNVLAPSQPTLLYHFIGTTSRSAIVYISLNHYESYADFLAHHMKEQYGGSYGYGGARLDYTKGVPTKKGHVYSIYFAEWAGLPFNFSFAIHGVIGGRETLV